MSSPVWQRKLTNLAWEPLPLGRAREGRGSKAATDAGLNAGAQRRGSRRQACLIDILNPGELRSLAAIGDRVHGRLGPNLTWHLLRQ